MSARTRVVDPPGGAGGIGFAAGSTTAAGSIGRGVGAAGGKAGGAGIGDGVTPSWLNTRGDLLSGGAGTGAIVPLPPGAGTSGAGTNVLLSCVTGGCSVAGADGGLGGA